MPTNWNRVSVREAYVRALVRWERAICRRDYNIVEVTSALKWMSSKAGGDCLLVPRRRKWMARERMEREDFVHKSGNCPRKKR